MTFEIDKPILLMTDEHYRGSEKYLNNNRQTQQTTSENHSVQPKESLVNAGLPIN